MRSLRPHLLRLALLVASIVVSTALAEIALRIVYRDAGTRTLGGPGGRPFEHLTADAAGLLRWRHDSGPKRRGVPRLLVVGDSITYGLGVRDWRDTWPEVLMDRLAAGGRPAELAVLAVPGADILQHVQHLQQRASEVNADVLIYQWYVNDIEAVSNRPTTSRPWQQWPWHEALRSSSYLYFVLDYRLSQFLGAPHRAYLDYLMSFFAPGTVAWNEFERQFHRFGILATQAAPRRIMMLYPQVPFRSVYPIRSLHDRMRVLAGPHQLAIAPAAWIVGVGGLTSAPETPWKQAASVAPGFVGTVVETRDYLFAPGEIRMSVRLRPHQSAATPGVIGALQLLDAYTGDVVATRDVQVDGGTEWRDVALQMPIDGPQPRPLRIRLHSYESPGWAVAQLSLSVDYGFEVVDLTEALNTFDTHASVFDAHPNEAAHRVLADTIYQVLTAKP